MKRQIVRILVCILFFCCVYSVYRLPRFNKSTGASSDILWKFDDNLAAEKGESSWTVNPVSKVTATNKDNFVNALTGKNDELFAADSREKSKRKDMSLKTNVVEVTNVSLEVTDTNDYNGNDADTHIKYHHNANVMLDKISDNYEDEKNDQTGDINVEPQNDRVSDESGVTRPIGDFSNELGEFIFTNNDEEFDRSSINRHKTEDEEIFKTFPNYQNETKYLIYFCDIKCGGLGDRLKGITMVYMMSLLTKRKFAINMTTPCDIEHFLAPNLLNWRVPPRSAIAGKPILVLDYFERYDAFKINYMKSDIDPATTMTTDYVWMKSNQDWTRIFRTLSVTHERFPHLYTHHSSDLSRIIYNGLFKPSAELDQLVNNFFQEKVGDSKLACLHARMGEEAYVRYTMEQIVTPLNFLKQFDEKDEYKIVVATDNQGVKDLSKDMFKHFVDTSGPILHIDYMLNGSVTDERKCSGFMRTLVDHMTLRRCDDLVLTSSGFGVSAASLRHTSRGLYVYMKDDKVIPTKRELLREVFQWRCIWRWWGFSLYDYYSNICDG